MQKLSSERIFSLKVREKLNQIKMIYLLLKLPDVFIQFEGGCMQCHCRFKEIFQYLISNILENVAAYEMSRCQHISPYFPLFLVTVVHLRV